MFRLCNALELGGCFHTGPKASVTLGYTVPPGTYQAMTVTDGLANVAEGESFVESQGLYDFAYTRVGDAARFEAPYAGSSAAQSWEAGIAAAQGAYVAAGVPQDGMLLMSATASRYGGRLVENVFADTAPTLNGIDFLYPRDEEGNQTPARSLSAAPDPLGGTQAVRLTYGSASHGFELVKYADHPGWTTPLDVTMALQVRLISGSADIGLGTADRAAQSFTTVTPTSSWQSLETTLTGFDHSAPQQDISLLPPSGAAVPLIIDAYGFQCHVHSGPIVLPSLEADLASAEAGHAPASLGRPGSFANDADGWVSPVSDPQVAISQLGREAYDDYTLAVWVDFSKTDYANRTHISAMSFLNMLGSGHDDVPGHGTLGMAGAYSAGYGRLHMEPGLSNIETRVPSYVLGQGPVHLAMTVNQFSGETRSVTAYINGVPVTVSNQTVPDFVPEFLALGGNNFDRSRHQRVMGRVMEAPDRWGDGFFAPRALSGAEIASLYQAGRASLKVTEQRKMLVMGSFDSLTANTQSPFWKASADTSLRPGTHIMLDAVGGSRHDGGDDLAGAVLGGYNHAARQSLRRDALNRGSMHYDGLIWLCAFGTNDMVTGVMDPVSGSWEAGRDIIDAMIARDIATASAPERITPVLTTMAPRGWWYNAWVHDGAPTTVAAATTDNAKREIARQLYNADCRANYAARGYGALVDLDAYVPSGFASLQAAAFDAAVNGENAVFQSDGIHFSDAGGDAIAADLLVPFLSGQLAAL